MAKWVSSQSDEYKKFTDLMKKWGYSGGRDMGGQPEDVVDPRGIAGRGVLGKTGWESGSGSAPLFGMSQFDRDNETFYDISGAPGEGLLKQRSAEGASNRILQSGGTVDQVREYLMSQGWDNESAVNYVKGLKQPSASSFPQSKGYTLEEAIAMNKPKTSQDYLLEQEAMRRNKGQPISEQGSFDAEGNWQQTGEVGALSSSSSFGSYLTDLQTKLDTLYEKQQLANQQSLETGIQGINQDYAKAQRQLTESQAKAGGAYATKLKRISGGLGESASAASAMVSLQNTQQQVMSDLTNQKSQLIQEARNSFDDKNYALAEQQIKDAMNLEKEMYTRQKDADAIKKQILDDQMAKAEALAPKLAEILSGDPETDQMAIDELANKHGIDPDYLSAAVVKYRAGLVGKDKQYQAVTVSGKAYSFNPATGEFTLEVEGATTGGELSDSEKTWARDMGLTYEQAKQQIYGGGGQLGDTSGVGTPAARNNNPGNIKVPAKGIEEARTRYGDPEAEIGSKATDGGYFIKFSDSSKGLAAIPTLLSIYGDINIEQAMRKWSNNAYGAEIVPDIGNKKLTALTPDEKNTLALAISKREDINNYNALIGGVTPQINPNTPAGKAAQIMDPNSTMKLSDIPIKQRPLVEAELLKLKQKALENNDTIGIIKSSAGGSQLGESAITKLEKTNVALSELEDLVASVSSGNTDLLNPIVGWLKSKNPYDKTAQLINKQLQAITPNLARGVFGEVGVLTDNDIKLYRTTLPNLKDTKAVQEATLQMLLSVLKKSIDATVETNGSLGKDVSGYLKVYQKLQDKMKAIGGGQSSQTSGQYTTTRDRNNKSTTSEGGFVDELNLE